LKIFFILAEPLRRQR